MIFTKRQIQLACEFKALGLLWVPKVGQYVFDQDAQVGPGSPFQPGVYFLLNYDCFMQRVGGFERFRQIMVWLPDWAQARDILRSLEVSDSQFEREILRSQAIKHGRELSAAYELIHAELARQTRPKSDVTSEHGTSVVEEATHAPQQG